jgi:serine/threonine-protein kinase
MSTPSIAHYRIASKLGEGGMGAVYRATDTRLNRDVAIKFLPDAFANDPDRLARFTREGQLLASLNHPNIAAVYGVEERSIVLELVEGPTLAERIARGPLSPEEALPLLHQLIDALEYAHDKGIVHRDLKPANLKITPEGRVKVLDFGLAKAFSPDVAAAQDPATSPTITVRSTLAGVIMGTAAYMSPEQARGQNTDRRSDIWAFGAVAYEMLTGRVAFDAPTVSDTLAAVLTREPDFDSVPATFRRLIRHCMARDARQRLSHISGARILLEGSAEPSAGVPARSNRLWIGVAAAAVLVALVSIAFVWRTGRPQPRPLMRLALDLGPDGALDARTLASLTPDGSRIVYRTRGRNGKEMLSVRALGEAKSTALEGTENPVELIPSPDGQWVAFVTESALRKVPLHGGAAIRLADGISTPRGGWWAEDGSIVIAPEPTSGLFRLRPGSGKLEPLTDPAANGQATHRWPQVLPGGRGVLYTGHTSTNGFNDAEIDVLDLKTGRARTVVKGGFFGRYLPSGHLVFLHASTLMAMRFDLDRMDAQGQPVPVLDDVRANLTSANGRYSFSPAEGSFTYTSGIAEQQILPIGWTDEQGNRHAGPAVDMPNRGPALSPDGRFAAMYSGTVGNANIRVWDSARDVLTTLTFNNRENANPVWTPDGKRLVFTSFYNGIFTLWCVRADGSGEARKVLERPRRVTPGSFSPDGRRLAVSLIVDSGASADIAMLTLDLSDPDNPKAGNPEPFLQTPAMEISPMFSPDGRWLAYTSNESGHSEIYVRPFPGPGGKWQISAGEGLFARWSRDGRRIYFVTFDGRLMVSDCDIRGNVFSPGRPRPWGEVRMIVPGATTMSTPMYDVAPDGRRILGQLAPSGPAADASNAQVTILLNFFDDLKRRLP